LHGAAGDTEDDGFEPFDPDLQLLDPPEVRQIFDRGSPNNLGWSGNAFRDDPQYGVYSESLEVATEELDLTLVFIATLGDAASEVRAPRRRILHGCTLVTAAFTEADLIGDGVHYGLQLIAEAAGRAELKYLVLAPLAPSFLEPPPDEDTYDRTVQKSYDISLRRHLAQLVDGLPDYKVLAVLPGASTWPCAFQPTSSSSARWSSHRLPTEPYGGPPGSTAQLRTRHWAAPPRAGSHGRAETAEPSERSGPAGSPSPPRRGGDFAGVTARAEETAEPSERSGPTGSPSPPRRGGDFAGVTARAEEPATGAPPSSSAEIGAATSPRSWPHIVRRLVADVLGSDLAQVTSLASTLDGAIRDVTLTERGKVRRHLVRGPAVWDPRAVKLQEDLACRAGLRDAAENTLSWPELWGVMAPVADLILRARAEDPELQNLTGCLGAAPARAPPSSEAVLSLRTRIGKLFGLSPEAADSHSRFSPWRFELVRALQEQTGDPDRALPAWLQEGAPMGIRRPLQDGGGIFPAAPSDRSVAPDTVLEWPAQPNHASFRDPQGEAVPPGHSVVQGHVSAGFALLFADKAAAERHLGSRIASAPLGCVSKAKADGTWKHRVIQDLKANGVNLASSTPERQVLPTVFQHARDVALLGHLAEAAGGASDVEVLVLDIKDAFMGVPLHPAEWPFNACGLDHTLRRDRAELYDGEPSEGRFVVWAVLGFGGKPNPLVFARVVSFAARTGQALFKPTADSPGCALTGLARLQVYVDDPIFTTMGSSTERGLAVDLLLLWWLALGLPLAWSKGTWSRGVHRWIGADFCHRASGGVFEGDTSQGSPPEIRTNPQTEASGGVFEGDTSPEKPAKTTPGGDFAGVTLSGSPYEASGPATSCCVMSVPPEFADDLFERLEPLSRDRGHITDHALDVILGKAGRLAYLVPACRPWVTALWGARAGSQAAAATPRKREAPDGHHATRRFAAAAAWLRILLRPPAHSSSAPWLPLETYVVNDLAPVSLDGPSIQLDASPWGGGAALVLQGKFAEHASIAWTARDAKRFRVELGSPRGQTTWEYLVVLLALDLWADRFRASGVALLGDNLAALNGAISLKGKSELNRITRELAWRKVRRGWHYACGHLPSEHNEIADALSRLTAPEGNRKIFPAALAASRARDFADPESLWVS